MLLPAPRVLGQTGALPTHSEIGILGGGSVGSIQLFGYAQNREIDIFGLQYDRHSFGHLLAAQVNYVAEALPAVLLSEPQKYGADSRALTKQRQWVYGAGIEPAGARLLWRPGRSWEPFLLGAGGVLYFQDRVLSASGTHLQFSAEFGAGLEFRVRSRSHLRIGYSFYHFSNGDIAARNPALDSNLIYSVLCFDLFGKQKER